MCDCTGCDGIPGTTRLGGCATGLDCSDGAAVQTQCETLCANYGMTGCTATPVAGNCLANHCDACTMTSQCPMGEACNTAGRVCGRSCTSQLDCGCDLCELPAGSVGICQPKAAGSTCADPRLVQIYLDRFYGAYSIALDPSSELTFTRESASGHAQLSSGTVELIVRDCPGVMCTMRLNHLQADGSPFAVSTGSDPVSVGPSKVMTVRPHTLDGFGTGDYRIPRRGLEILVSYVVSGTRYRTNLLNTSVLNGHIGLTAGDFQLQGGVISGPATVAMTLNGHVTNFPPVARPGSDRTVSCTGGNGTTPVALDGSASSDRAPGPLITQWRWYEGFDRDTGHGTLLATGATPVVNLGVGAHTLTLMVIDGAGAIDLADVRITVVDDLPPEVRVSIASACLWPPNHRLAYYEVGEGISASAYSRCWGDVAATATITDVRSSEPALVNGSGHTVPDVFFAAGGGALCVRSERAGPGAGREYTVTVGVVTPSGTPGSGTAVISVPHDRGHGACRDPIEGWIDDGDARCDFTASSPGSSGAMLAPPAARSGCDATGGLPAAALIAALALRRRRWLR